MIDLDVLREDLHPSIDGDEPWPMTVAEGRALLAYVDELLAERTGTIHESWQYKTHAELLDALKFQGAITKSLLSENAELREAAGKVTCWRCLGVGIVSDGGEPCPDCTDLRRLLGADHAG